MNSTERSQVAIQQHAEQLRTRAMYALVALAAADDRNGLEVGHSMDALQAFIDDLRENGNCGERLVGLLAEIGLSETLGQHFIDQPQPPTAPLP